MKIRALIFCLCLVTGGIAQKGGQARIDSIVAALPAIKADTSRVRALLDIANTCLTVNPGAGPGYVNEAIALAEQKSLKALLAEGYNLAANLYKKKADYAKSNDYARRAFALGEQLNDRKTQASALAILASNYFYLGDYPSAIDYYLRALRMYEEVGNKKGIANVIANLGNVYYFTRDYDKAIDFFTRGYPLQQALGNKLGMAVCVSNLGYVYIDLHQYDKALGYLDRSQKLYEELNDPFGQGANAQARGRIYVAQHDYLRAVESYRAGLRIAQRIGNKQTEAQNLLTIAEAYVALIKDSVPSPFSGELATRKGLLAAAIENTDKAIAMRTDLKDMNGLNFAYETKSEIESLSGNAVAALASFQKHIVYRDSVFNLEKTKEINRRELQYEYGKREDSLRYRQALTAAQLARQELIGQQQQQQLTLEKQKLLLANKESDLQKLRYLEEQARLQHEKELQATLLEKSELRSRLIREASDHRIEQQQLQIHTDEKIKIYLALATGIVLLVAFVVYYSQQRTKRLNTIIIKQKTELEELGQVKDRLFSVVSHDMRTPVNSLISFIDILEDAEIPTDKLKAYSGELKNQLSHTSVLMENLLNWASSQMAGFTPQTERTDLADVAGDAQALLLQQAAFKGIKVENRVPAGTQVLADRNMLSLIMRNTISNAIKFTQDGGLITIDAVLKDRNVNISVRDSGTGMPADKVSAFNDPHHRQEMGTRRGTRGETGTGLGLMLCKLFASLMNGSMRAESREGKGTLFTLELPAA